MQAVQQYNQHLSSYSEEDIKLLRKAGLIGDAIITLHARVSSNKRPYSTDGRTWKEDYTFGRHSEDRRNNVDIVAPSYSGNYRINGHWANNMTRDEIAILTEQYGIPTFTVARTIRRENAEPIIITDSAIKLWHGKEYDLSDPAQMAEWLVVKETGVIAPELSIINSEGRKETLSSQENVWSDDWYSFYYTNSKNVVQRESKKVMNTLELIQKYTSYDVADKILVARLMHYKGYNNIENYSTASDHMLEMMFNASLVDAKQHVKLTECINIEDKPMFINLYRLIELGRVISYGANGPYHLERTGTQERGSLLGNSTEEAVINLTNPSNIHLLNYIDGTYKSGSKEHTNDMLSHLIDRTYKRIGEDIDSDTLKNRRVVELQSYIQELGHEPASTKQPALQQQVKELYNKWKQTQE